LTARPEVIVQMENEPNYAVKAAQEFLKIKKRNTGSDCALHLNREQQVKTNTVKACKASERRTLVISFVVLDSLPAKQSFSIINQNFNHSLANLSN